MRQHSFSRIREYGKGVYRALEDSTIVYNRLLGPTPQVAIYMHGAAGEHDDLFFHPPTNRLIDGGFLVISIGGGGHHTWGNDSVIDHMDDCWTYLQSRFGATEVIVMGGSMGTVSALTWARQNIADVAAMILSLPIPDVEAVRAADRGGFASEIEAAYTNNAGWQAARPTHNPIEFADELAGIPIRLDYSDTDNIGTMSETFDLAAAIGSSADLFSIGAIGHSFVGYATSGVSAYDWLVDQVPG